MINTDDLKNLFDGATKFRQVMMMYNCAIKEVRTKFEILNDDLSTDYERNPIEMIKSRIKTPESIITKIQRKGLKPEIDDI